jgi:hypothetical protein
VAGAAGIGQWTERLDPYRLRAEAAESRSFASPARVFFVETITEAVTGYFTGITLRHDQPILR